MARRRRSLPFLRAFVLVALAAAACTPEFDDPTLVKDLRLLAINADPPEVLIDLPAVMADPARLATLPTFEISPLVVDPRGGGRAVEFQVLACENRPDATDRGGDNGPGRVNDTIAQAACPEGATPVAAGSVIPGPDGSAPITISFTPTPELLIAAVMADPLSLELGLPLVLSFTFSAGSEQVVAIKRVLFSPRLHEDQRPNRNPRLDGLWFRESPDESLIPLDPDLPPTVPAGGKLRLRPAPAEAEPYLARAFSTSERRFVTEEIPEETLRYSFYATGGTFSPGGISTRPPLLRTNPAPIEIESTFQASPEADGEIHVFVVVRDERGGSAFIGAPLLISKPP